MAPAVAADRSESDTRLADACARYAEVGLKAHPDKVFDFSTEQDLLGYRLERNVLRAQNSRYDLLRAWVRSLEHRGWANAREVERLVGNLTHLFLIQRLALSIFAAVYAFAQKCGHRRARLWPSVLRELRTAIALVPLARRQPPRPRPRLARIFECSGDFIVGTRFLRLKEVVSRSVGSSSAVAPRAEDDREVRAVDHAVDREALLAARRAHEHGVVELDEGVDRRDHRAPAKPFPTGTTKRTLRENRYDSGAAFFRP